MKQTLRSEWVSHPPVLRNLCRQPAKYTQSVGARLHHEGHPGLTTRSTRNLSGDTFAFLKAQVLTTPRDAAHYSYEVTKESIVVKLDRKSLLIKIKHLGMGNS